MRGGRTQIFPKAEVNPCVSSTACSTNLRIRTTTMARGGNHRIQLTNQSSPPNFSAKFGHSRGRKWECISTTVGLAARACVLKLRRPNAGPLISSVERRPPPVEMARSCFESLRATLLLTDIAVPPASTRSDAPSGCYNRRTSVVT